MRVWASICNIFAVFLILAWMLICETQYVTYDKDYDTAVLKVATDYASEAAICVSMSNSETLGTDYMSIDNVTITSGKVLDIFCEIMCMCYDMPASEINKMVVEDAIAGSVICTNDGYYEALPTKEGLSFTVKKPYTLNLGEIEALNDNDVTLAVRLGKDSGMVVKNKSNGVTTVYKDYDTLNSTLRAYGFSGIDVTKFENVQRVLTANKINDALTYSAEQIGNYRMDRNYRIYIPAYGTSSGINSIDGPTIIMLMRGTDFTGKAESTRITMSGYRIVEIDYVVGFEEDGVKYYCYEDQVPDAYVGSTTTYYFKNVYEAAKKGYIPHLGYMVNE